MNGNSSRRSGWPSNKVIFGLAALVLMCIVGVSYREWGKFNRARLAAAQSRETADSVNTLLSDLSNAETGQRGYLLTGEERYLEPYNRAIGVIPAHLARVKSLLAARHGQPAEIERLDGLIDLKLAELQKTIELRRESGFQPAVTEVRSDRGLRAMAEIRALGGEIQRRESSGQGQITVEAEAAAGTTLMATVAGSMVLLFLFAFGLEPIASADDLARQRTWPARYGVAVLAVVVVSMLRWALIPLIGQNTLPFELFLPAVWFAAWFGGFGAGVLSIALSMLTGAYLFAVPSGSFRVSGWDDQVAMLMLILVGFGMALLSHLQERAVARAIRAESAERQERQRFETTLASIGDAVMATDAQGRITFTNQVACSLLKVKEAEVLGKNLDEVFHIVNELTRARVASPVAKVLREGEVGGLANHSVLIARDGTEIPIDDSGAPIRGQDGTTMGTVLVFRDISERRHAETTMQLLASIVESSDDAIISKDLNGIVTTWNQGASRIFGYAGEEMIGRPISVLAAPGRREEMRGILERIRRGERVNQFRTLRQTKSGKVIHASVTISPLRDAAGRITGASKILRDVTAQVEAEAQVAEERERLRVTLRSIGDGVIATDTAGLLTYLNPVAESLTGWASGEAAGKPLEKVFRIVNEESRETVENPVDKVLRERRVVGLANHTMLIARDGREFAIDDSAAPIMNRENQVIGVVLIFRDSTGKRAAEQARRASELSALLLRIQDEERRHIGRELHDSAGQDLVILKMNLDELASNLKADEATQQKLADSIRLADAAIGEIRTTSYTLYPPMLEEMGLRSAIPIYLDGLMERSDIEAHLEIPPDFDRPSREAELALFRVLQESLTNILRHSGSRQASVRVDVTDGMVQLEVRDQGRGLPAETLEAFRTGAADHLGVGLRGMKERVRQLGGKLDLSSTSAGTVVCAAVPYQAVGVHQANA